MRVRGVQIFAVAGACFALACALPSPAARPGRESAPGGAGSPAPVKATAEPDGPALLFRGASVMTAAGPTLERADVLVVGSKIRAVGAELQAPAGTTVIDAAGRWITPGLIDPHSHLGVYPVPSLPAHSDGNEATGPFKPEVRALESFWPQDPGIQRAVAGGVTTILALPGSANLVGGQGATLHLGRAIAASEMQVAGAPKTMKMACGENPKRVYGDRNQPPDTRMAEVAMLRQELEKARAYEVDAKKGTEYGIAAMQSVVRGDTLIQNHCYRADEMLLRLEMFGEFGVTPRAFHHAVEAYKIAPQLAAAKVGAVVWADWWGSKIEMLDGVPANAAILDAAGVRVSLHSDSPLDIQRLNQQAAASLAAGLRAGIKVDRERAIRWITANPAWILGIDARTGTLEASKDADLVVWSGDPFSIYTHADLVYSGGRKIYDRADPSVFPPTDFELGTRLEP